MPPRSCDEWYGIEDDFIHHTHPQQPVDIVSLFRSDFCQIADSCIILTPFVEHRNGIVGCDMIKGMLPYFVDATFVKVQFFIRLAI